MHGTVIQNMVLRQCEDIAPQKRKDNINAIESVQIKEKITTYSETGSEKNKG